MQAKKGSVRRQQAAAAAAAAAAAPDLAAHLEQEVQRLARQSAGKLVFRGQVQRVQPGGAAADLAGEAVPQQVGALFGRLHKAQQPLALIRPKLVVRLGVLFVRRHKGR